jgi:hypothetical protein
MPTPTTTPALTYTAAVIAYCRSQHCSAAQIDFFAVIGQALDLALITLTDAAQLSTLAVPDLDAALLALRADVWLATREGGAL